MFIPMHNNKRKIEEDEGGGGGERGESLMTARVHEYLLRVFSWFTFGLNTYKCVNGMTGNIFCSLEKAIVAAAAAFTRFQSCFGIRSGRNKM